MLGNGALQFAFINTSGAPFTVVATTNIAIPSSDWTVLGAAAETPASHLQFTDLQATSNPPPTPPFSPALTEKLPLALPGGF